MSRAVRILIRPIPGTTRSMGLAALRCDFVGFDMCDYILQLIADTALTETDLRKPKPMDLAGAEAEPRSHLLGGQ